MAHFKWRCPFCDHSAVITQSNSHAFEADFNHGNRFGHQRIVGQVVVCPNSECGEYSLSVALFDTEFNPTGSNRRKALRKQWSLIPESKAKPLPSYIPAALVEDYTEACLIADKSPKASATLSRRCLQGMIRDFWGISGKRSLAQEIDAIRDMVDLDTWEAIDALRRLGNIGAHMERDISLIVEVDADEAELLIELIETLFEDWYVRKHERQQRMAKIKATAAEKDAQRKGVGQGGSDD